ncbi:hypothetical protein HAX54_005018 [Datura stramonium]|uniref:CCHC-type domain-containing protein n=1 Tax=Datura stramonium TaxID=4076 RepID=A0ABS8T9E5_DATST|nr:hypothetical protein [Datura stramonium]
MSSTCSVRSSVVQGTRGPVLLVVTVAPHPEGYDSSGQGPQGYSQISSGHRGYSDHFRSNQQMMTPKKCYEYGDPRHIKRDCPRLRQRSQQQGS